MKPVATKLARTWIVLAALSALLAVESSHRVARAQLNDLTLELFQKLMPQLDEGLRTKFRAAIDANQSWIEFTPDEFRRFRNHPANPFDGLDKIDPQAEPGKIRLEFKIPSPRDRIPITRERQHRSNLQPFDSSVAGAAASTAQVLCNNTWVALGTVVGAKGWILTKASEVENRGAIVCRLSVEGRPVDYPAQVFRVDEANDLALLKVDADQLTPVRWTRQPLRPGQFVATGDHTGQALVVGVVSTAARCLISVNQAYLGVQPVDAKNGVELAGVTAGGSAQFAGLKVGDVITHLGERPVQNVTELVNAIRLQKPGSTIPIRYLRDDRPQTTQCKLNGRNTAGKRAANKSLTVAGAIVSGRRDDFPLVFQHDSPLLPEHCGGPLVDLDGNVIGINIARASRVSSFALAADQAEIAFDRLLRENVASRE
jgi:serine protease Do